MGQALQHQVGVRQQVLCLSERRTPPGGEGRRCDDEREHQKHSSACDEQDIERRHCHARLSPVTGFTLVASWRRLSGAQRQITEGCTKYATARAPYVAGCCVASVLDVVEGPVPRTAGTACG